MTQVPIEALPTWAETGTAVEPNGARKASGHANNDVASSGEENWVKRNLSRWTNWNFARAQEFAHGMVGDIAHTVRLGTSGNSLSDVAGGYDNHTDLRELFCAVGADDGTSQALYTSRDCETWTKLAMGKSTLLTGVAYDFQSTGDKWVAVGWSDGTDAEIYSSNDPSASVTERSNPLDEDLRAVTASGAGLFVAVGQAGYIVTSPDGITWTQRTAPNTSWDFHDVHYANGLFVAVGHDDLDDPAIATSPDGITWTARTVPGSTTLTGIEFKAIAWTGTAWIASSFNEMFLSADGLTWTQSPTVFAGGSAMYVAAHNGVAVVFDGSPAANTMYVSLDGGASWQAVRQVPSSSAYQATLPILRSLRCRHSLGRFFYVGEGMHLVAGRRFQL